MIDKCLTTGILRLQKTGRRERLNYAQDDGEIARVLRDLAAAEFAFFLQTFKVRKHHGHQLQDDGGRDVRHDAKGKNRQPAEIAAAEKIEDTEGGSLCLRKNLVEHRAIDSRRGNVRTNAVHG